MEAKDTVIDLRGLTTGEVGVANRQAEISFKAGEQESDKKWRQILKDSVTMAKLAGIKEVVEWIEAVRIGGYNLCIKVGWDEWQAKLKEWGIIK